MYRAQVISVQKVGTGLLTLNVCMLVRWIRRQIIEVADV
jgi:hypothetical protein